MPETAKRRSAQCSAGQQRRPRRSVVAALLGLCLLAFLLWRGPGAVQAAAGQGAAPPAAAVHLEDPDQQCAGCHAAIVRSYKQTAKARGSGLATEALLPGSYHDVPSGVDYRVFLRDSAAWMSFTRSGSARELAGERQLLLFVGSGRRGRTYLYRVGDLWYELPINFYTRTSRWEMAPNMEGGSTMPAALPVDPNCLHCHASAVQSPLPQARNRFAGQPFLQGGIGCAACHGDSSAHVASQGKAAVLNPASLPFPRRESLCLQCHLEGDAVVYRAGRSLAQFRPGDDLADTAVYFVRAAAQGEGLRATSQYEALLRSACRRGAGERLTCTTCHDPHSTPSAADRVAFFRSKCLSCHTSPALATIHHPEQPDCAACHMPSRSTADISHEQVTDHDIEARPRQAAPAPLRLLHLAESDLLQPVGKVPAGDREFGLAYAQMAHRGAPGAASRALTLLRQAEAEGAHDPAVAVELGFLEQSGTATLQRDGAAGSLGVETARATPARGREEARAQYLAALAQDPWQETALANLVVLEAQSGDLQQALPLLQRLVGADPGQTAAGLNLAFLACELGKPNEARRLAESLARINPDDPQLRDLLQHGRYQGRACPALVRARADSSPALLPGPQAPAR